MPRLGRRTIERTLTEKQRLLLQRIRRLGGVYVRRHEIPMARELVRLKLVTLTDDGAAPDGRRWWCVAT